MMKTFLFDYGGTLDTGACHWFYVFQEAYQAVGCDITEADLRQAYVMGERALAKERIVMPEDTFYDMLVKKVSVQVSHLSLEMHQLSFASVEEQRTLVERIATYCDAFARSHTEQSTKVLKALKEKGYGFVMVSNFYGNLHSVLRAYGLLDFFDTIVESAVVGVRKPDPAIWQLGVEEAKTDASSCIAVGDSYGKDIVPASQVGCQTVWFKGREWEEKAFDESLPTHVITSLEDILKFY